MVGLYLVYYKPRYSITLLVPIIVCPYEYEYEKALTFMNAVFAHNYKLHQTLLFHQKKVCHDRKRHLTCVWWDPDYLVLLFRTVKWQKYTGVPF